MVASFGQTLTLIVDCCSPAVCLLVSLLKCLPCLKVDNLIVGLEGQILSQNVLVDYLP